MAQIDLKNATIRLKDGSSQAGAVNHVTDGAVDNVAGYAIGQSVIDVDGFVGIVVTGSAIKFSGHATEYKVTAHTETTGNTTEITITPALTSAVVDDETIDAGFATGDTVIAVDTFTEEIENNTVITFAGHTTEYKVTAHSPSSGPTTSITLSPALTEGVYGDEVVTAGPRRMDIKIGEGKVTYSEKRTFVYVKDRGELETVKEGDEVPLAVALDFIWEFLTASTGDDATIEDVLKHQGAAANWDSSATDPCEPFALDVEIEYIPPCGDVDREIILLKDFRWEELNHDLRAGTVAVTGNCNVTRAEITRVAT